MSYLLRQHTNSAVKLYKSGTLIIFAGILLLASHAAAQAQCSYIGEVRSQNSSLGLNPVLDSGPHGGGLGPPLGIIVASQAGCDLTISGRPDWMSFGQTQFSSQTVTINGVTIVNAERLSFGVSLQENPNPTPRTATIRVGGLTFTITQERHLTLTSAASFQPSVAGGSIVSLFSTGLSSSTVVATSQPLPTTLGGVSVQFKTGMGIPTLAPLFFVSPGQINFQVPPDFGGPYRVAVINNNVEVATRVEQPILGIAPGLFTFNQMGTGVPTGSALRVRNGQPQPSEPIHQADAQNRPIPLAIDLGPAGDQVFLVLYGTGFRRRSALSVVDVKIGGTDAMVTFAGAQGQFIGVDQLNVLVPRSLIGRGEVDLVLTVDGEQANAVRVNIK